ncbi:hypothetical protein SPRG_02832 [Saprolegnia parasitica CBS 223.65]|uniref:Anoctamin transmembrane domain-containing protein n=1 Tax=Saprolegnia parasitica (strain CBS 223.65) TaxID=695850 RepID=A0A067CNT1_SAPPC|nr:hypothetical protein SPRG_02832 [Saprolegnia parasitica CBS 223.65]KDO32354.1 hypothetical protein SPRG_02832 [Saprolegnia parasitica CBS 223.65]|eukprot:XP_012196809.1 hypothetical protein SPRG_02832 [Saprolegnia parasitica CBS 223.65]
MAEPSPVQYEAMISIEIDAAMARPMAAEDVPPTLPSMQRPSVMASRTKPFGATDYVLELPHRSGGEVSKPDSFTQKAFVQLMLGFSVTGIPAVLRTSKCFVSNDGHPFTSTNPETFASTDWVKSHNNGRSTLTQGTAANADVIRRIDCLRAEYLEYIGSSEATTEALFCELIARAVAKRIQLVCGLSTTMFHSQDGKQILVLIQADEGDLRIQAERTKYRLQTSNKPFSSVHADKLARIAAANPTENVLSDAKTHLLATRGHTKGISVKNEEQQTALLTRAESVEDDEPEMDPWLISRGAEYQVKLYKALMMWGHNEAADGLFPPPATPETLLMSAWQRFRNELIYIPRDPYNYFALYTAFKSDPKLQPYYRHHPGTAASASEDTLFRSVDRIRLVHSILDEHINFEALKEAKYFTDLFALHDIAALQQFTTHWATNKGLTRQPLGELRNYFGEKIALYFAWLEFYTKSLLLPAVIGIIIYVLDTGNVGNVAAGKIFFAGFIVVWSTFFTEFWKRKTEIYTVLWGVDVSLDIDSAPRTQYKGVRRMNPVDNSPQIWDMATATARRRRVVAYLVVLLMVLIVLGALGGLFYLKHLVTKLSDPTDALWASVGVSVLNSIQINILNVIYRLVAQRLNDWENHRTSVDYENHLITKVFLFQFCNSFASFFYIAYIKAYIGDKCLNNSCLMELRVQLFVLFVISTFVSNAIEIAWPRISSYAKRYLARTPEAKTSTPLGLSDEETQALWAPYEEDDAFADYNEMVIQYGFVTLFVVAMPITPAMALFNNVLEAHVDAYKLCNGHRRPYPHRVASIGSWYYFLCLMNYLAVATNIGILLFTQDPDDKFTSHTSTTAKWIIFIVAEHVCIFMKSAVAAAVPDVPRELAYLRDRHKDIEATVFLGQVPETDDDDLSQQAEKLNLCIHATAAKAKAIPEIKPAP